MARKRTNQPELEVMSNQDILITAFGILIFLTPLLSSNLTVFAGVYDQNMWLMAVVFLFAAIFAIRYFFLPQKSPTIIRWLDILIIVWLLWLVTTTFTSYNPTDSFLGVVSRTGGLLHWIAIALLYFIVRYLAPIAKERLWRNAQNAIIIAGTAVAVVGLLKLLFGTQEGVQLIGTLGNQNFTAYYLAVVIITTYIRWITNKRTIVDWSLLALIIQVAALWFTHARWVYVVILIAVIIIHLILAKGQHLTKTKNYLFASIIVVAILLLGGSFMLGGRAHFTWGPIQHRLAAWELAWEASLDRPILGWGLENYDDAFQVHFQPEFEDYLGKTETFDRPHNFLFLHLVTTGWIGLLLFLSILGLAVWAGLRHLKRMPAVWALGVVGVYIGINLLGFEMIATTAILAVALAYLGSLTAKAIVVPTATPISYAALGSAGWLLIWLAQLVVAPWIGYQLAWRAGMNGDLDKFHQASRGAPYLRSQLALRYLTDHYLHEVKNTSPAFYTKLANYLEDNANHRDGQPGYQLAIAKAWELSDNPNKFQKVKDSLLKGMATHNYNNGYYWAFLAGAELSLGNPDAAMTALQKAKELNPDSAFTSEAEEKILADIERIRAEQSETP